jgi:hypothetical protein
MSLRAPLRLLRPRSQKMTGAMWCRRAPTPRTYSSAPKTQDVAVNLGPVGGPSVHLGIMKISAGQTALDVEFPFALIAGPSFSITYITNVSVAAGCGGANYSNTGSTITLSER